MRKTILAFGEVLWDLLPGGPVLGGAPCNFAYRANSLGDRGVIISRLGRDDLGQRAAALLAQAGMGVEQLQHDDTLPTGTVQVSFDAARNPDYFIVPKVAYDAIEVTDELVELAEQADAFCFGTLVQRAEKSRSTLRALLDVSTRSLKFFDINLRKNCFTPETIADSLRRADVLKLNETEAAYLAKEYGWPEDNLPDVALRLMERWTLTHCVITLGAQGALAASVEAGVIYAPGYQVKLVDSCGSGDAFAAAFLHGLLRDRPLEKCIDLGNALGALVATQRGATETVPSTELQKLLATPPGRVTDERFAALRRE